MATFIIAEAGVNHNGSLRMAQDLALAAKDAGADAVKFQLFKAENLVTKSAKQAEYQTKNLNGETSQFEMLKKLELNAKDQEKLFHYCKDIGIQFMSSPFCLESADELEKMGMEVFKIPSGEITTLPLLRHIAKLKKTTIISTGMCHMDEVIEAVDIFKSADFPLAKLTILHCNTEYPTPFSDVNLLAMTEIKNKTGAAVGYSDHTLGIEVPTAAVALGATVIEKHFTLDKSLPGPDHKASLSPLELKAMVEAIRNIELARGNSSKVPSQSEKKNISAIRKSIVAKQFIKKGETLSEVNLTTKRPGIGLSPMKWDEVIGKTATKDYELDEFIEL